MSISYSKILLIIIIGFLAIQLHAQCPDADELFFSKQQELLDFKSEYPNCQDYEGRIILSNQNSAASEMITDLSPLSELRSISFLTIKNDSLGGINNFNGISSLERLTYLNISDLCCIENLEGLETLDTIQNLRISHCPSLVDFEGLEDVQLFFNSTIFNNSLILIDNPLLESISGFTIPARSFEVQLIDNPLLNQFGDLNNFSWATICRVKGMNDLSFLNKLELMSVLDITGNENIKDLSFLKSYLGGNDFILTDFPELSNLDAISGTYLWSSLSLNNCGISNVRDIQLREPKQFEFYGHNLSELNEISLLTGHEELRIIDLNNCPALESLSFLSSLEILQYNLRIDSMPMLRNLRGLDKLKEIGRDCSISGNQELINLEGLNQLKTVGFNMYVSNNLRLFNFQGLDLFENIGITLEIENNPSLISLDGFESFTNENLLTTNAYFRITNNIKLESILGIRNCNPQRIYRISENPKLAYCAIPPVCFALTQDQSFVRNNKQGCNRDIEVFVDCEQRSKAVQVFLDENENGAYDSTEEGIAIGTFILDGTINLYPNNNGILTVPVSSTPQQLNYEVDDCWRVTTNNQMSSIDISNIDELLIGITPKQIKFEVSSHTSFDPIICDQEYFTWFSLNNIGTTREDYIIEILGFGEFIEGSVNHLNNQDTIETEILQVLPGQAKGFWLKYLAPSVEDYVLGNAYDINVRVLRKLTTGDEELISDKDYSFKFKCAYDPNDKQVFPQGQGEDKVSSMDTPLQYTIRFQNTGNYLAKDVVILDTLDADLDLSTFSFISASHDQIEIVRERNFVSFKFENIYLPDSTSNEVASHGYVSYSVKPKEGLAEGTIIENTANIYFDSNPAIVTNTTKNTLVSDLSSSQTTFLDADVFNIYPNPCNDKLTIKSGLPVEKHGWTLFDVHGRRIQQGFISSKQTVVNLDHLKAGIYFVKLGAFTQKLIKL